MDSGAEHMKWRPGRKLATALAGLMIAGTLACSSGDPIEPNNGLVAVQLAVAPTYTGPFLRARLQIDQVTVRPFDPLANAYLGIPIGLLQAPVQASLRAGSPTILATLPLQAGTYRLDKVRIGQYELNVVDQTQSAQVLCDGNNQLVAARPSGITLVDYVQTPPAPVFTVPQGVARPLVLSIDGAGLVAVLESQPFTCGVDDFPVPTSEQIAPLLDVD